MKLRYLLFLTLSGIAVIPVITLTIWITSQALDKEVNGVEEKHLLLAKNIGLALERYSLDIQNAFELVSKVAISKKKNRINLSEFMKNLYFVHLCIADLKSGKIIDEIAPERLPCPSRVPQKRFDTFVELSKADTVVFSPVMRNPIGIPTIYLLQTYGDKLVIGAISTKYIVELGKSISFGKKGHAAIVDQNGKVLFHPSAEWRKSMKNISSIPPVKQMMAKKTGVTTFYSPALKADMISGYTFVSTPKWGVMIPQPYAEISASAKQAQIFAVGISIVGLIFAAILSWILSGYLTRSLSDVVKATRRMAEGDFNARVKLTKGYGPTEVTELGASFNTMAEVIEKNNADLSQAVTIANTANRTKTEFLANMSHELRTPLNAIIGFSDVLNEKVFGPFNNEKQEEYIQHINDSGQHLLELITDILDVSAIEADRLDLNKTNVKLHEVIDASLLMVKSRAEQGGVDLVNATIDPKPIIHADKRRMKQILVNLLSNAIKFTDVGGTVSINVETGKSGSVTVSVVDNGIGMNAEEISLAILPFNQLRATDSNTNEGTGLGLPLTNKLVEAHGGTLSIQSKPDVGTTVIVEFPKGIVIS